MPKIMTKTLLATLLWRNLLEHKVVSVTQQDIDKFKENIMEYIETNYKETKYNINTSEDSLNKILLKEKWLKITDKYISINRDCEYWENELIFNKDYYDNIYPNIKSAYRNSPLPEIKENKVILYNSYQARNDIKLIDKKIKNFEKFLKDLEKNNSIIENYIVYQKKLKELYINKNKIKINFILNCHHDILYMNKKTTTNIVKCLSCEKEFDINKTSCTYLSGILDFYDVKALFEEFSTFTKNVDNIITMLNLELK